MSLRTGRVSWIAILAVLVVSTARAADDGDAAALIVHGVDQFNQEDYEGARTAFARAYALSATTRILFNLALAELQSGHFVESVRHIRAYLAAPDAEADKVEVLKAKWLPRAEARTSRVQVDAPAGAAVGIDDDKGRYGPLDVIDVSIGDHDVVARSGAWSRSTHVVTRPGEFVLLHLLVKPYSPLVSPAGPDSAPHDQSVVVSHHSTTAKVVTATVLVSGAALATGLGIAFAISAKNEVRRGVAEGLQLPPDPEHSQCTKPSPPLQCPAAQRLSGRAECLLPLEWLLHRRWRPRGRGDADLARLATSRSGEDDLEPRRHRSGHRPRSRGLGHPGFLVNPSAPLGLVAWLKLPRQDAHRCSRSPAVTPACVARQCAQPSSAMADTKEGAYVRSMAPSGVG